MLNLSHGCQCTHITNLPQRAFTISYLHITRLKSGVHHNKYTFVTLEWCGRRVTQYVTVLAQDTFHPCLPPRSMCAPKKGGWGISAFVYRAGETRPRYCHVCELKYVVFPLLYLLISCISVPLHTRPDMCQQTWEGAHRHGRPSSLSHNHALTAAMGGACHHCNLPLLWCTYRMYKGGTTKAQTTAFSSQPTAWTFGRNDWSSPGVTRRKSQTPGTAEEHTKDRKRLQTSPSVTRRQQARV